MKKALLFLASTALLLVGCAKEKFAEPIDGGMTNVTFTASLDGGVATKSAADNDGKGTNVNRCIMEIYFQNQLYKRMEAAMSGNPATTTFSNVPVVAGKQYQVLFWADCGGEEQADKYYTTTNLKTVTVAKEAFLAALTAGENDNLDAFFFADNYTISQNQTEVNPVFLKRPFAQLNVITTDVGAGKTVFSEDLLPEKVSVSYTADNTINVATGTISKVGESEDDYTFTYEADVYGAWSTVTTDHKELTLSMDYILASTEQGAVDVTFKTKNGTTEVMTHNLTNLPYKRNYRTNVKGELLTTGGTWTATIAPAWEGNGTSEADPYLVNFFAAGSIAAANEALKTNNAVSIENPTDHGTSIVIPGEQDGNKVFITVTGASSGDIVVEKAVNGPATLDIESDSQTLNIDLPNSHVNVNKGNFTGVTANTSATTLVVGKDVTIDALTINGGYAEIYGLVDEINRADGVKAEFYVSNSPTLAKHITLAKSGDTIDLECDIDLVGTTWNSPVLNADFNGNNHIIKNIKNPTCAPDYAGLFKVSYSNIKNVIIQNAEFAYGDTKNARGGALVGDMRSGSIENCHVDGIKFDGYQKVGGLVGFLSKNADNGCDISIKNCSVKNATFAACGADDKYLYQTGGLIGYIQLGNRNISISNCSVDHIIFENTKYNGVYDVASDNSGFLSHTFVGIIFSDTNNAGNTLSFTANTISGENTQLNASMYGSAYFGWARNPEYSDETVTLGKITIDGVEWAPDYPVKIVGGKGYATLAAALSAATEGQTVQILKAGEYTFPGTQKAITVEGLNEKDENDNYVVAFNLRTASGGNKNVIFKHLTFNLLQAEDPDRGFTGCENLTYNECVFTGEYWGYDSGMSTFNNCVFHDATKYSIWTYGGNITLNDCEFFSDHGKFVNVYATGSMVHTIYANNCIFHNTGAANKAAFNLKGGNTHGSVVMTNCSVTGNFPNSSTVDGEAIFSDSGLYMFDDPEWSNDVYAKVDGITYYPYFSMDANGNYSVKNANGLKMAIKHWNALKVSGEMTITLAGGTYEVSDMVLWQNLTGKSLVIKAAENADVTLKPVASGNKSPYIFLVAGGSSYDATRAISFNGIKFDYTQATNVGSAPIYCCPQMDSYVSQIEGITPTNDTRYAHNITFNNCSLSVFSAETENISFIAGPSAGSPKDVAFYNCTMTNGGYIHSGYINGIICEGCTVSGVKALINSQGEDGDYTITIKNNTIQARHDYIVRTSGGKVIVENNNITSTYSGSDAGAGVVVVRKSATEATFTGNTFTKSSASMWDCYCGCACTVNGDAKAEGTGINF